MKKIVSFLFAAILTTSMSVTAFAAENNTTTMNQTDIRAKVVEIIATSNTIEERDQRLSSFLENNPLKSTPTTYSESNTLTSTPDIVESVTVDENTSVDFYSTGDFGIKELEDLGAPAVKKSAPIASTYGYNYTNTYKASYTIKNLLGGKIVETYVTGYFKYNGSSTPTPYFVDAGYNKGFLVSWDCSSWDEGTGTKSSTKSAYCYADAYYDWTLDVSLGGSAGGDIGGVNGEVNGSVGTGVTIQDCNVFLKLNCSKYGIINGTVSLN